MPDDDLAADMYELAMDVLEDAGYEHYEISNWAMSGYRSRHNLAYWLNRPYLGCRSWCTLFDVGQTFRQPQVASSICRNDVGCLRREWRVGTVDNWKVTWQ